jgi:small conductance mechanosensitive channel
MNDAADAIYTKLESWLAGFFWLLPNLVIAVLALSIFAVAGLVARRVVVLWFHRRGRFDLGELLGEFARWGVIGTGVLFALTILFPSVRPADALATLGIGSVAIGFALRDILQNWFAGLLILIRQPFRRGDQIEVEGFEGTVEHIEARATLIRTYDGRLVVIPNGDIYTRSVTVNTAFGCRRSEFDVGIGYGDDIDAACRAILDAMKEVPGIRADPPPQAFPWDIAASSIMIRVWWWSTPDRAAIVATRAHVIARIKSALDRAAVDIPYPTTTVLFHDQTDEADGERRRQREGWPAGDDPPGPRQPAGR